MLSLVSWVVFWFHPMKSTASSLVTVIAIITLIYWSISSFHKWAYFLEMGNVKYKPKDKDREHTVQQGDGSVADVPTGVTSTSKDLSQNHLSQNHEGNVESHKEGEWAGTVDSSSRGRGTGPATITSMSPAGELLRLSSSLSRGWSSVQLGEHEEPTVAAGETTADSWQSPDPPASSFFSWTRSPR